MFYWYIVTGVPRSRQICFLWMFSTIYKKNMVPLYRNQGRTNNYENEILQN